jgi:hypothetical protein
MLRSLARSILLAAGLAGALLDVSPSASPRQTLSAALDFIDSSMVKP